MQTDFPVLTHVAITHAQFETIHPFPDGNGRTGRALVHAMLHAAGVTRNLTVPVSAGLLADLRGYFAALDAYRTGNVVPIVQVFTAASFRALTNTRLLIHELRQIRSEWDARSTSRSGSSARRALELLPEQPVVSAQFFAEQLGVSFAAATNAIDALVGDGILRQSSTGRRNRTFQSDEVLHALDAFAERSRRPRLQA